MNWHTMLSGDIEHWCGLMILICLYIQDDGPPLPKREYNEPETHSDTTKSSVTGRYKV